MHYLLSYVCICNPRAGRIARGPSVGPSHDSFVRLSFVRSLRPRPPARSNRWIESLRRSVRSVGSSVRPSIAREIDQALAGFIRGQSMVCLFLGLWYGIGLTLIGLDMILRDPEIRRQMQEILDQTAQ